MLELKFTAQTSDELITALKDYVAHMGGAAQTAVAAPEPVKTAEPAEPEQGEAETFKRRSYWKSNTGELQMVEPGQPIPDRDSWEKITGEEYTLLVAKSENLTEKAPEPETPAEEPATEPSSAHESVENSEKLTVNDLRAWVVAEYLNACFDSQDDRRTKFKELCAEFKVDTFKELPEAALPKVKARVEQLIAEHK